MARLTFLLGLVYAAVGSIAAPPGGPQFDYLGSERGEAQIRGRCQKTKDEGLQCHFLEVRPVPVERFDEKLELDVVFPLWRQEKLESLRKKGIFFLDRSDVTLEELRPYYVREMSKSIDQYPDRLIVLRDKACREDPRDYYRLRGAYNETFDEFLGRAKEIQDQLCKAADAEAYAKAHMARWDVDKQTCELKYAEYVEEFRRDGDTWKSEGSPRGPGEFVNCFFKMRSKLECRPGKGCRLEREYLRQPETSPRPIAKIGSSFNFKRDPAGLPTYPEDCALLPTRYTLAFEPGLARARPPACRFLLDRERAMYCCAYGK